MNNPMLRWWTLVCVLMATAGVLEYNNLFVDLYHADRSGLSFIALSIFVLITAFIGFITHNIHGLDQYSDAYTQNIRYINACWYISELLMAIGMMGTLIGFMMMLGPSLTNLITAGPETAKNGIFSMAAGMSTSVTATLTGLITSQLVKLQLINIEVSLKDE